jgi:hypothetical protein
MVAKVVQLVMVVAGVEASHVVAAQVTTHHGHERAEETEEEVDRSLLVGALRPLAPDPGPLAPVLLRGPPLLLLLGGERRSDGSLQLIAVAALARLLLLLLIVGGAGGRRRRPAAVLGEGGALVLLLLDGRALPPDPGAAGAGASSRVGVARRGEGRGILCARGVAVSSALLGRRRPTASGRRTGLR